MVNIDFELVLVGLTFITGVIYLIDVCFFAKRRKARFAKAEADNDSLTLKEQDRLKKPSILVDYSRSLFPIFLLVLLLRSFLFEPFRIPSGSLEPTLLPGDFILVNKYKYGVRLPILRTKLLEVSEPKRGDIIVFRWPADNKTYYIKRLIGLPGDTISYVDKKLTINGKAAEQIFEGSGFGSSADGKQWPVEMRQEDLLGVKHDIYVRSTLPPRDFHTLRVPEGYYFMMGDNRDDSADSRFWGFVPENNLVGKAIWVWMSWNAKDNDVRMGRLGQRIQ